MDVLQNALNKEGRTSESPSAVHDWVPRQPYHLPVHGVILNEIRNLKPGMVIHNSYRIVRNRLGALDDGQVSRVLVGLIHSRISQANSLARFEGFITSSSAEETSLVAHPVAHFGAELPYGTRKR